MQENEKWRKMLLIGMISAFMTTVLGDMPIGWVVYPKTGNQFLDLTLESVNLSVLQMGCATFFGAVFIPLQCYGVKALAEIISKSGCSRCGKIIENGGRAYGFLGGTVHVLCVAAIFVAKTVSTGSHSQIPKIAIDFSLYLLLPISLVFLIFYLFMCIAIAIPVFKGKTNLPQWAVIFNPLTGKILLNAVSIAGLNTKIFNALRMGNMGVGLMMTLAAFYISLGKDQSCDGTGDRYGKV